MSDNTQEQEFDLNDPNLSIEVPEGYDPEGELVAASFAPPKDGPNRIRVKLMDDRQDKPAVYYKNGVIRARIKAWFVKPDGTDGQFLKDWYPSTQVFDGQVTSDLAKLCHLAGHPLKSTQASIINQLVRKALTFEEGQGGLEFTARTRWNKSVPDGNGGYTETTGMARIAQAAVSDAQHRAMLEAQEAGLDEEQTQELVARKVDYAVKNPHLYVDDSGEERSVRAEVRSIVGA